MDLPAEKRWTKVIDDYKDKIMKAINNIEKLVEPYLGGFLESFINFLTKINLVSYSKELEAIAK